MRENHLWNRAKELHIETSADIVGGFDVGFDERIPEKTKDALMGFVYWVEDHFSMPVTLWVDFKYNHYLMSPEGKRVGHRFYWVDFTTFPRFENEADLPVIESAVRTEHRAVEEMLLDFIRGICQYFSWLQGNEPAVDEAEAQEVLEAYLGQ